MTLSRMGQASLLAVAMLTIVVGCVIVPGLPTIAAALGQPAMAPWLVTLPALGVVLVAPLAARMNDRLGLYPTLCWGLFFYAPVGLAGAWAPSPALLVLDRLVLGFATATVMTAGTGLLTHFFTGRARLGALARQGMAIELGGVAFLCLGGLLVEIHWRAPFFLYLSAWLLLALVRCFVPHVDTRHAAKEAGDAGQTWSSGQLAVFIAAAGSMAVFFIAITSLPFRLSSFGVSEQAIGYFLSGVSLIAVGAAALVPRLVQLVAPGSVLCLAFLCYGCSHLCFAAMGSVGTSLLGGLTLGLGFGFSIPLANYIIVELSPVAQRNRALGHLSMAIFAGQFGSSFVHLLPGGDRPFSYAAAGATCLLLYCATQRRGLTPQLHG